MSATPSLMSPIYDFLRDIWIRTQSTAVESWRATDLGTHIRTVRTFFSDSRISAYQKLPVLSMDSDSAVSRIYQEVAKRCRLSWLINSALVNEPKRGRRGGCGVSANEFSCAHGAEINFGDLITPYLTLWHILSGPFVCITDRYKGAHNTWWG